MYYLRTEDLFIVIKMRKIFDLKYLLCVALAFAGVTANAQKNVIDEVVWVVGDEAILKSDIEAERLRAQYEGQKWDGDPDCVIPEQMAIQKLYLHQAAIDSIEVTESEVQQRVEQQMNWYIQQIGSKEKMEEYFNKPSTQIREQLHEKMQQQLVGDIKLTPAEVRRYFANIPQDSIPYVPTSVEVQIITLQPRIPQTEIDRIKDEMRSYTDRVNKGETSFSTLALLYSEDQASARRGGELGFMGRGELVPEYANVAFNLTDPKKVSKIVESEFGFHIIQLIEKRGDKINTRHILRKPRVASADLEAGIARLDSIADDIRSEKFPFEEAAAALSADKDTRNNRGLMANQKDGTPKFEMQDLPAEIAKVVDKMQVGEISKAFTMVNSKGKEVCAIVKLRQRVNGHKATLKDDFQRLKDVVVEKKREEKLEQWIKDKLKNTYVRVNDDFKNCNFKYSGWIK